MIIIIVIIILIIITIIIIIIIIGGRCGGPMVSALVSEFVPWPGHCVVFLGKTLYSHNAILHPGI